MTDIGLLRAFNFNSILTMKRQAFTWGLAMFCLAAFGYIVFGSSIVLAQSEEGQPAEVQSAEIQEAESQTSSGGTAADLAKKVLEDVAGEEDPGSASEISLDFLNEGKNPKSVAQLKAMQAHVREISDRVKEATVNVNVGAGQGTGVIVSSDGIILTAAHVIQRPRKTAIVTFSDGRRARARTLGVEAGKDSGMLKIVSMVKPNRSKKDTNPSKNRLPDADGGSDEKDKTEKDKAEGKGDPEEDTDEEDTDEDKSDGEESSDSESDTEEKMKPAEKEKGDEKANSSSRSRPQEDLPFFPYLDMGISGELKDGQWVIAVGHPGGLDPKRGMVVRVGRVITRRDSTLRTDCTLVGGDSGGPLVDMDGNLVGIHSRIGSRLQDNLHVPVDVFSDTWDMLTSGYKIGETGWLGVSINAGSRLVSDLNKTGPALEAGVQVGDIIIAVDGKKVENKEEIGDVLSTRYPYEKVELTIRRGSNEVDIEVMLGEKPQKAASPEKRR